MWKLKVALATALVVMCVPTAVRARNNDVVELIQLAAVAHHVSPSWMVSIARCESTLDPFAVSPDGSNLGLFQLNRYGLLPAFYARGYDNPFDPAQESNFTAEQLAAGHASAWSCA
jgi:hypothetical protein